MGPDQPDIARGVGLQGIFVGTFLIGLREGLEATLIVSIVGAFLRRNGRSIRPMLLGVVVAIAASVAVGVGLDTLSAALPQRQQEMLETVIGAVAVVFVTTMIIWMNRNARHLRGDLEQEAAKAINTGGSAALASMAFLAVLKEGFETAVFLLAAAQATHGSGWSALSGAVAGIGAAIAIGVGMYFGGLKVNLGRFFRITGVFLVFIAAGLVVSAIRTAHEAGWLDIGQQQVLDLSWWIPARSVRGALITGMFGIPSDPRLIEVLGWLSYLIPVLAVFLLASRIDLSPRARRPVLIATSAGFAGAAILTVIVAPHRPPSAPGPTRAVTLGDGRSTSISLHFDGATPALTIDGGAPIILSAAGKRSVDGIQTRLWQGVVPTDPGITNGPVSLARLVALTGGRLPVGLSSTRTPGPFDASWTATSSYSATTYGDSLVSATQQSNRIATLRGGGLSTPKTVSAGGLDRDWSTSATEDAAVLTTIAHLAEHQAEQSLWRTWLALFPAAAAAVAAALALRRPNPATKTERHRHNDDHTASLRQIRVS